MRFSLFELPHTPPPCIERKEKLALLAWVSKGIDGRVCRQPNCLPAFSVQRVAYLKYRFLGTARKYSEPIWDGVPESSAPGRSSEAWFVRVAGDRTLVDWEITAASFPEIRNRSEELRNHCISLIVLWVALCRSFSEMKLLKTHSSGLAPKWGFCLLAQDWQRQEFICGDVGQVWGSHPDFSAHPDLGREHCFQDRKMSLGPSGACHFSQKAMSSEWLGASVTSPVTFLLHREF